MKTAVITGCNRGLGLSLLERFTNDGFNVIACLRKESAEFTITCKKLEEKNDIRIYQIFFDMTNMDDILRGLKSIQELNLVIDVLVNNSGVNITKPLINVDYGDLEKSFQVNYYAPVMITKEVAFTMMRQGYGCIINISSMMSLGHQTGGTCYDASKSALNQFTYSIAQELAPFNIRVNGVASGPINTEMFAALQEKVQANVIKKIALKRAAETDEISSVVVFLASEKASYITGQILRVDGGAVL